MNDVAAIRKRLGRLEFHQGPKHYLNTGDPNLNGVLGCDLGIPYGKIIELAGMPSNGKTGLLIDLCSLAQADGAHVIWVDFENSFDRPWAGRRGLKCEETDTLFSLIEPYLIEGASAKQQKAAKKAGKVAPAKKRGRLTTAEELLEEMEALIEHHARKGAKRFFIAVDSITSMVPEGESAVGISQHNLVTQMELPKLLSRVVKKWVGIAATNQATFVLINQIRTKPVAFGDPNYSPGGNAIPFYAHVRVRVKRVAGKSSLMRVAGRAIGVRGIMENTKNKAGGVEGDRCGFKLYFDGRSKFMKAEDIQA